MEYTIGQVWDEAEIVVDRVNGEMVTQAVLFQSAVASILSEKAGKEFSKLIKQLVGEE